MPTTFANTINGNYIYAKRAEQDKDGNQIDTTYAKTSDIPTNVVPGVTSSDDGKVLKASYSDEQGGSYSWQTESGGGGGGSSNVVILESTEIYSTYSTLEDMFADIKAGKLIVIHVSSKDMYFYYTRTSLSFPYFANITNNTTGSGVLAIGYCIGSVNSSMQFSFNEYKGDGMLPKDWITPGGSDLSQDIPIGEHTNGEYIFVRDAYRLRCYKCILAYTEAHSGNTPAYDTTHWSLTDLTTVLNELRNSGGLPSSTSSDAGKVLTVNSSGSPEWQTGGGGCTVDQNYNASSTNAQSGTAVAQAISEAIGPIESALANL